MIPRLGRSPGGGHRGPLQYCCLKNPHGQRTLGYCPWGHKESDTTEQLSTQTLMTEFPFLYCQDSLGSSDINPTQQRSSVSLCASVSVSFCFTVSLLYFFCLSFSLHCYFRQIFLPVVEIMDANNTWLLSFHVHYTQSPKQGHISWSSRELLVRSLTLGSMLAAAAAAAKSLQSCLTLCNPTDGSPPDSAVPGILQARTLEWVAISFSNI